MNKVTLTGRITKDPEKKTTQSGLSVVSFTVACDRRFKNSDGSKSTDFIQCVAWRTQADYLANYGAKGMRVGVLGSIQTRSYEDQSGTRVNVVEVVADEVELLESKQKAEPAPVQEVIPVPAIPDEAGDDDMPLPFDIG